MSEAVRYRRLLESLPGGIVLVYEETEDGRLEYTVAAAGSVTVWVGALDWEEGFYVEDDRPGISADERERVFERSYSTAGSTGLGPFVVRSVAEVHGWDVTATGGRSGGVRFEVSGTTYDRPREGRPVRRGPGG